MRGTWLVAAMLWGGGAWGQAAPCGCVEPARIEIRVRGASYGGQPWDETGGLGLLVGRPQAELPDLAAMLQPLPPDNRCPALSTPISLPDTVRWQRQTVEGGALIQACGALEWFPLLEVRAPGPAAGGRMPELRLRNTLICQDTTRMTFEDVPLPHLPYRISIVDADFDNTAELVFHHNQWTGGLLPFALRGDGRGIGRTAYCAAPTPEGEVCELVTREGILVGTVRVTRPGGSVSQFRDQPEKAVQVLFGKAVTGVAPIAWASTNETREAFQSEEGLLLFFQKYGLAFLRDSERVVANCDAAGVFRVVANYLAPLRPTYFGLEEETAVERVVDAVIDQVRADVVGDLLEEARNKSADRLMRDMLALREKGVIKDQLWERLLDVFPESELPFPRLGSRAELMKWVDSEAYRRAMAAVESGRYTRFMKALGVIDAGISAMKFSEDVAERLKRQRNNAVYLAGRARFVELAKARAGEAMGQLGFVKSPLWAKLVVDIDEAMRHVQAP